MDSYAILLTTHVLTVPIAVGHILLFKEEPRGAFGWIATSLLLPVGGPCLYALFGINRIRMRARKLTEKGHTSLTLDAHRLSGNRVDLQSVPVELSALNETAQRLTRLPVLDGNHFDLLRNGDEALPAMLEAIDAATQSICMTTYIMRADSMGRRFCQALVAAAGRGVTVRLLIDGVGCLLSRRHIEQWLKGSDVQLAVFLPPRLFPPSLHVNLRDHRKLLLVDGRTGFVGGMNINEKNLNRADIRNPIQDLHFQVSGPILNQLREVFCEEWAFTTGEHPELPDALPLDTGANALCRVIADGPSLEQDRLATLLFAAIAVARESIVIITPYFLPSRELTAALAGAALRGVDVTIIIPQKLDRVGPQWARSKVLPALLRRGVRILTQPPPFAHTKLLLIDSQYAVVGSANIDPRSLRLNFELGVEVYRSDAVTRLAMYCDDLFKVCTPITLAELEARSLAVRLRDGMAWLASPYM